MSKIVIKDYEYGHPKNEDYAYDVERQRQVDAEQGGNDHVSDLFRKLLAPVVPPQPVPQPEPRKP